ncbi:MAG: L-threonylcarbamoyladenylate synthase [Chloroherpetonaceae bacterium]|nr:L-threonylcarbamoyladenylate synthase [Chloroherpetonaceae bacterium]
METKLTRSPKVAAQFISKNELVAFPTETVFGLGANLFEPRAVEKIFLVKGRPSDNPLIAHFSHFSELDLLVKKITPSAEKLIEQFFPGPLTIVLPKSKYVPDVVSAGLPTIGIRMPSNPLAHDFLKECGVAIAAPSANLSGKPSATTWEAALKDLNGKISCILKGEPTLHGLESTIIDCSTHTPLLLRSGAISLEELQHVVSDIQIYKPSKTEAPKSPGMKYRHYAPNARIILVHDTSEIQPLSNSAYIGLHDFNSDFGLIGLMAKRICNNQKEYASSLFHFFRECDELGVKTIYCERISSNGIGLALMDRLEKAAKSTH